MADRPTGVTIIAILGIIVSLLALIGGLLIVAAGGLTEGLMMQTTGIAGLGGFIMVMGAIAIILALVGFFAFYWLLKMKKAGFNLVIVIGIISIILAIPTINIISIVLWLIIIIYLYTKRSLFS